MAAMGPGLASARNSRGGDYPRYSGDLFSSEALRNPFPIYRAIRDAGPVVEMAVPDVLAISRFGDVQQALRSPDILVSGKGVGFNKIVNAPREEPAVISSDGDRHRRLRAVLSKPLMPAALKEQRSMLKALMHTRLDTLLHGETFDAVAAIAQHLPLSAVTALVGLPEADREKMLGWGARSFNALGPETDTAEPGSQILDDLEIMKEARRYFLTVNPAHLAPGSWAAQLFNSVEQGRLRLPEARAALSGLVFPSLDTTIYSKANLLYNLACNPDQWRLLRENPSLVSSAVLEGVRHSAVVRWFSRVAVADYTRGEVHVPAGRRIMIMYGAANRDERHYPDPDRFDVTRNPIDHLGWGTGPHMCAGMHLARLEMEVMVEALLERVDHLEADRPVIGDNRTVYGIDHLPMRLAPR